MNRYDIKNKKTGIITHSYTQEVPPDHHPLFGELERWKWVEDCSPEEIADALSFEDVENPERPEESPHRRYLLPQTYEVLITDLTEELAQETTRRTAMGTLKQRLKVLAAKDDLTAAEVKESIMKWIKLKVLSRDLD